MNDFDRIKERQDAERWEFYRRSNRNELIRWTQELFENPEDYVILATKQIGFREDREIELTVFNLEKIILCEINFKGIQLDNDGSTQVYNAPKYRMNEELAHMKAPIDLGFLARKKILAYNFFYHASVMHLLIQSKFCYQVDIKGYCIQKAYSQFVGSIFRSIKGYISQELPNGGESANDDCIAIYEVLKEIANSELQ